MCASTCVDVQISVCTFSCVPYSSECMCVCVPDCISEQNLEMAVEPNEANRMFQSFMKIFENGILFGTCS